MWTFSLEITKELLAAWRGGSRRTRGFIVASGVLLIVGLLLGAFSSYVFRYYVYAAQVAGGFSAGVGALIGLGISALQRTKEEEKKEEKIKEAEKRVQENPKETQAAWIIARTRLESYLKANISQVTSIFWLTVLVMTVGFVLIGIGTYRAFHDPQTFNASVLSSISGIIVSFIGGTFLVLYKATMAQAKDYVNILERINAVGMSVQILEALDDGNKELKDRTTAEVARQLLLMYSTSVNPKAIPR